ncbi:filamentous hemagglutinin N-terminal domain-containing protein [Arcobacter sp. FWKO B]|uniref:two-partner secretion domain-containing protein n=1 Tax=Arcobacter sp. FWKO B TaxID=2593672 RepID=UPI0018A466D6|nr:filamentous hemagglutinin N-terminal domain-containing protein [Arcobacter sp. FWKO B]QOG12437.1 filamentous hemagglutinin N-terminal domain-containing protein [Arcobacter sp. FWKO B]
MKFKQSIAIFVSFILVAEQTALYAGGIEVDTQAPSANKATLLNAPNNVPIVNIVTPNSSGLSHNKFTNFNVDNKGLILNNSKVITDTQLAGYISYNPNLTGNEAKLILNEVTSTNKTLLQGYTEVAGKSADVIIANPNGISVNGGGFINTPNATLTTGTPMLNGGVLQGFDVSKGNIIIEGSGFNGNNIDKVNLYAKALEINSKIYANELNVVTGENNILQDGTVTSKNQSGSGISIDSTLLGGIYANTITLKSTDKGIGVNLPPEVFAQNSLYLSSDGNIVVSKVLADNQINITSKSEKIKLTGDITADNITLNAGDEMSICEDKIIKGFKNIDIASKSLSNKGEINALDGIQTSVDIEESIDNQGLIGGYDLDIKAKNIDNSGALYSKNNMKVTAQNLDNSGLILSNKDIELLIQNTLTNQKDGTIYSEGNLSIASDSTKDKINTINNYGLIQSDKNIDISANTLNNTAPTPSFNNTTTSQTKTVSRGGSNDYDIVTTTIQIQSMDIPTDPALILAMGDINIDVNTLNNNYSLISSNEDIVLNANTVNNIGKVLVSTTTTVTKQYRDERYCSSSGPSGTCFNHKHRAAYRGTLTSTKTERVPMVNYGIQAKKSITGNVVTLNNISDQLSGSLSDQQILNKLNTIDTIENGVFGLQKLILVLQTNDDDIITSLNNDDIETLISQISTQDDVIAFKDNLVTLKQSVQTAIDEDTATLDILESIVSSIKSLGSVGGISHDTSEVENTISLLKNNIIQAQSYITSFEALNDTLVTITDVTNNKQELLDINSAMNNIFTQNSQLLASLDISGLNSGLENASNTLRNEVNTALDLNENIEYKIITNDEGLYKTNTNNSLSSVSGVNYSSNSSAIVDDIVLPKGKYGLFLVNKATTHPYLIESNPLFTNYNTFISSDYMLDKLDFRPEKTLKRLGDGMYETQFVNNSIIRLSGGRYLDGYSSDMEQFQGLMDNALSLQSSLGLRFGITLSKEQIAQLNKNIVWMEERVIDGQSVLVPVVYLASNNISTDGAKILANGDINLKVEDRLLNDGLIVSRGNIVVKSGSLTNENGVIVANDNMNIEVNNSLKNLSGNIVSSGDMNIKANNIQSKALSEDKTYKYQRGKQTSTLQGKSSNFISGGNITMQTQDNMTFENTNIKSNENITLTSNNGNVTISSQEKKEDYNFNLKNGYNKGSSIANIASNVDGKNVTINANRINVISSNLTSKENLTLQAQEGINIEALNDMEYKDTKIKTSKGFIGKETKKDETSKSTVISSTLNGKSINIDAQTLSIQGSTLTAEQAVIISEIMELVSLKNSEYENHFRDKSGVFTRTIASKGSVSEEIVPALIQVQEQLKFNKKDITDQLTTDNIIKTLSSEYNLTHEQINLVKATLNNQQWDDKTTSLSGLGAIIVAIVVTVITAGAGAAVVGAATTTATTAATTATLTTTIQTAVAQSLVTGVTTQLATSAITGNSFKLDTDSLIKGAVSAGVLTYANTLAYNQFDINTTPQLTNTQLAQKTLIDTTTQTAIYGGSFTDNLLFNAGNTVQGKLSNLIGDNYINGELNYATHKLAHLGSGAIGSAIRGEDLKSGALGAITGEVIGEAVGTRLTNENYYTEKEKDIIRLSSQLGTVMTASALGKDAKAALNSSIISVENNIILHAPGTFSNASDVDESFKEAVKKFYNDDELEVIDNDGKKLENNDVARQQLADKIVDRIIEIKKINPNEPIYLTGHSHGGNVQKIVTQKLVEQGHTGIVDSIMYLGTPVRNDYVTNNLALTQNASVLNVYDKDDMVQSLFGGIDNYGLKLSDYKNFPSKQLIINNSKVQNIQVESPKTSFNESFYYKFYGDHIQIDNPEVIQQIERVVNE